MALARRHRGPVHVPPRAVGEPRTGGRGTGDDVGRPAPRRRVPGLTPTRTRRSAGAGALSFRDYAGQEKVAELPAPLNLDGAPKGSDAAPLTIGYYVPDQRLVLYYQPV